VGATRVTIHCVELLQNFVRNFVQPLIALEKIMPHPTYASQVYLRLGNPAGYFNHYFVVALRNLVSQYFNFR